MRRICLIIIALSFLFSSGCGKKKHDEIVKVITFNIRYDNPRDKINAWPNRAKLAGDFLNSEKPDIIGMQEVLINQYDYLDSVLTGYGAIGVGRSDGVKSGEMNPLFYRKDRFDLIRTRTFWLSETPEVAGSKAWGAGLPRIVTWAEFSEKQTLTHFYFFNTHFAHDSDSARIMSARLLLQKVDSIAAGFPFVISGDFNMLISAAGYKILTGPFESIPLLEDSYAISRKRPVGPAYTFNGFSDTTSAGRIDYIFVRNGMEVLEHRTFIRKQGDIFISDHWPVMSRISLKLRR